MIKEVEIKENEVIFHFEDYKNDKSEISLKERFLICTNNRWNFDLQDMERYFIEKGKKGCYLGTGENYKDELKKHFKLSPYSRALDHIQIWDLSLIFPQVNFSDNNNKIFEKVKELYLEYRRII